MQETHFGFQTVPEEDKATRVRGVFDSVAFRYDLMNDLMSAGLHRLWKRAMIDWLSPRPHWHVLDVAGGTGDIAFRINERSDCRVTLMDINAQMLQEGRNRAIDTNRLYGIEWVCGNAEALPFPDAHFDAYTIAFGIRNVTHIDVALKEALRVLKPGGRFLCLEFSPVNNGLQPLYDAYSFRVIPWVGERITGDRAAYQYLVESIRRFPDAEEFKTMITKAGFGNIHYRKLSSGVVALHSGRKL